MLGILSRQRGKSRIQLIESLIFTREAEAEEVASTIRKTQVAAKVVSTIRNQHRNRKQDINDRIRNRNQTHSRTHNRTVGQASVIVVAAVHITQTIVHLETSNVSSARDMGIHNRNVDLVVADTEDRSLCVM
jgi:hypothetical protein